MKVLIFNQHPDCSLYMWKAMTEIGFDVFFATEELTMKLGFPHSSTKNNKFEVVNTLYHPHEFNECFQNVKFSNVANHDLYLSILPEVVRIFGDKSYWDAQMQHFLRNFGSLHCRKSCNHPDAEQFGFKFCANWTPQQKFKLDNPTFITQLITQANMMSETVELSNLKKQGYPVKIYGGDQCEDGFIRDIQILPHTSLLVHNKQFGINCYSVCKALDLGIPVYMSKSTKQIIGFNDLPDELFLFKDDISIVDAYKISLTIDRKKIQDTYRSIYTLDRTVSTLKECLK
jgi:hypothetical protein